MRMEKLPAPAPAAETTPSMSIRAATAVAQRRQGQTTAEQQGADEQHPAHTDAFGQHSKQRLSGAPRKLSDCQDQADGGDANPGRCDRPHEQAQ